MGAAGETSVGDEGDSLAEALTHDGAGGSEHLAHARSALGAFVADDDDVAVFDLAVEDTAKRGFFGFVDDGLAGEGVAFLAGDLGDGAFGGEVTAQDAQVAVGLDRIGEGADDVLVGGVTADVREVLGDGLAGDGHAMAVQEALIEEHLEQRLEATDADKVGHVVFAARLEVGEHRHASADALKILEGEFDARGMGHRDEVQYSVRRTTEGDDDGDGVLERVLGEDVGRADVLLDEFQYRLARALAVLELGFGIRELRRAVRQAESERFDGGGHGVRGIHTAARAFAGDGADFDLLELAFADLLAGVLADGFEDGDDVGRLAAVQSRDNRAAVDKDGRAVEARHGDGAARHVLVAATDGDEAVETFRAGHRFDGIRNDLARDERVAHARGAHRDTVRDGDGAEDDGLAAGRVSPLDGFVCQPVDVHVAGGDHRPGRGDAHDGLGKVGVGEAHGPEHGSAGGAVGAVYDDGGVLAAVVGVGHDGCEKSAVVSR